MKQSKEFGIMLKVISANAHADLHIGGKVHGKTLVPSKFGDQVYYCPQARAVIIEQPAGKGTQAASYALSDTNFQSIKYEGQDTESKGKGK